MQSSQKIRFLCAAIPLLSSFISSEHCFGEPHLEDPRVLSLRTNILATTNLAGRTNRMNQAVQQLDSSDRSVRLEGVSDLILCSFLDAARMQREKIGDAIVSAYSREDVVEIKFAMLATLDMISHPSLTNLLRDAERSTDPLIRNLSVLIKEKQYLDPVVNRSSKIPLIEK